MKEGIVSVKNGKNVSLYFVALIVAIVLEVFVFNIRTWESLFFDEINYPVEMMDIQGMKDIGDGTYVIDDPENGGIIYIYDLQSKLNGTAFHNVRLDIELPQAMDSPYYESGILNMGVHVRDEGHDQYVQLADHVYRQDIEDSKYLWIKPAGNMKTVTLELKPSEGNSVVIKKITINSRRDIHFSIIRFICVLTVLFAAVLIRRNSGLWETDMTVFDPKKLGLVVATGVILILPSLLINLSNERVKIGGAFRPYQLLAEALDKGQLYLDAVPPEELAMMENPYDETARTALGLEPDIDYLWDTAYYQGHYYTYFGVVPCVLFYLPVWHFMRTHLNDAALMLIMAVFVYTAICLCVYEWGKKHKKDFPFALYLILCIMIFLGSGMMTDIASPDPHDIPRVVGVAFVLWGLYLWMSSVKEPGRQLSKTRLAFGSLCMALAVGCRPNLVLYSFMAIPVFWEYTKLKDGYGNKERTGAILSMMLPYVPIAAGLMAYNAFRFGSITDFGYAYNLTVLDYTKPNVFLDRIVIGVYEFLLRLPRMDYHFPFVENGDFAQGNTFGHGSFYYTWGYGGLLACNLLMWCLPAIAVKEGRNKGALWLAGLGVINMFVNICVAGVAYHYRVDFAAFLLMAAAIGAATIYNRLKNTAGERIFVAFLLLALVLDFVYQAGFCFISSIDMGNTELYYRIMYAFQL